VVDEDAIVAKFSDARRAARRARDAPVGGGGGPRVRLGRDVGGLAISRGRAELERGETLEAGRVRRPGAGRKALTETDPTLLADLDG
jgi:hypothetical protein